MGSILDGNQQSDRLGELCDGNKILVSRLREAHSACEEHDDIATINLMAVFIDETERRTWFLFEASRPQNTAGH